MLKRGDVVKGHKEVDIVGVSYHIALAVPAKVGASPEDQRHLRQAEPPDGCVHSLDSNVTPVLRRISLCNVSHTLALQPSLIVALPDCTVGAVAGLDGQVAELVDVIHRWPPEQCLAHAQSREACIDAVEALQGEVCCIGLNSAEPLVAKETGGHA